MAIGEDFSLLAQLFLCRLPFRSFLPTPVGPDAREFFLPIPSCEEQIPAQLVIHPERGRGPEELRKAKRCVRREIAASVHQAIDPLEGNTNPLSQLRLGQAKRFEEFLP